MTETTWALDPYSSLDDPALAADRQRASELAQAFSGTYRGRVAALRPAELRDALAALEDLRRLAFRAHRYVFLKRSEDGRDRAAQAALSEQSAQDAAVHERLAFFQVELGQLTEDQNAALLAAEELAGYRHWLEHDRKFAPHTLSVDAEQAIARKDVTGKTAWVSLYDKVCDGLTFDVEVDGEVKALTRGEAGALMVSEDRVLRQRAHAAVIAGFEPHREVLTHVFDTLFEDHRLDCEARGYQDPMDRTVLEDDLPREVVLALLETCTERFELVHRYQALRKRVLGLHDYGPADRRIPTFGAEPTLTWEEARAVVTEAFAAFDPAVGDWAHGFFDRRRIDALPRPGKTSGGFCAPSYPPDEPFVLMNFAGTLDDTFTLAHELGHALHFTESLAQSPLNYHAGRAVAETASVFGEAWLHEHLMSVWTDDARRRLLLDRQIRDAVNTAFAQVAYVNWERAAHGARGQGALQGEVACALWSQEMQRLYGPGMAFSEGDSWRWATIPHFVFARFYCYSYAFGKMLTLGLHDLWREQGDAFVAPYRAMLAAGGSVGPVELVAPMGLDLADPGFWGRGCDQVDRWLTELEALA